MHGAWNWRVEASTILMDDIYVHAEEQRAQPLMISELFGTSLQEAFPFSRTLPLYSSPQMPPKPPDLSVT